MGRFLHLAFQVGEKVAAIEFAGLHFDLRGLHCGRGDIKGAHGVLVDLPSGDRSRPSDEKGHVHPALGEHAFLAIERIVETAVPSAGVTFEGRIDLVDLQRSAVVADEEDQGLLGESVLLQRFCDQPDTIVDRGEHAEGGPAAFGHLTGETVFVRLGRIERRVWGAEGDIEKEGPVMVTRDHRGG